MRGDCSPLPQRWCCFRQGSRSDLRISMGTPAGLGKWWSGVPSAGGRWMQRSGRALRPQGTGAPWASSEALVQLALSAQRGPENQLLRAGRPTPALASPSSRGLSFLSGSELCPPMRPSPRAPLPAGLTRLMSCSPVSEAVMSLQRAWRAGLGRPTARRRWRHLEGHAAPTVCTFLGECTPNAQLCSHFQKLSRARQCVQVPPGCSLRRAARGCTWSPQDPDWSLRQHHPPPSDARSGAL